MIPRCQKDEPHNPMTLPLLFREALSDAGMLAIDDWWEHLDERSRSEALDLWYECRNSDADLAVRVEARFADDQEENGTDYWHSDYYDYLVNHEIYLFKMPGIHICTRHPVAAAAVRAGTIPHNFCCPFQSADCPMRRILSLAPDKSLRLSVKLCSKRSA